MTDKLAQLEQAINYGFADRRLLEEALTHRSFVNESDGDAVRDNQRLEFFGDTVISFILSRMLLDFFPEMREGELSKVRASLVDEESLAGLAVALDLGIYLRLGRGEDLGGGRRKRSLLADAYEALVAAVYLDGGLEPATRLVRDSFSPRLLHHGERLPSSDFKTAFQELAQAVRNTTPRYVLTGSTGPDHDRRFQSAVYLGEELMGEGSGRSRKESEQTAAKEGMQHLMESAGISRS